MAQNCATDRVLLCFWHCRHEVRAYYDFGEAEDSEWLVDEIIAHQWKGTKVSFLVQWNLGDTTWEPYSECKDLMALDRYLELLGIKGLA